MRNRLVLPLLMVLLLAACGGGSANASPGSAASPAGGQASAATDATSAPAADGSVDCAKIKTAAIQLLAVQLLAQLRSPETVEPIKTKQIGDLDLDQFLAGMHDLHALDSFSSPLGDPKAAIDFYEEAGKAAQVLFATEPVTQAAIDTYDQKIGTVADFLGHQSAIAGAMSGAGC
jgi:hypothetical protein